MKTGIELIAIERQEQIEKHGFDVTKDKCYSNGELIEAILFSIDNEKYYWPKKWLGIYAEKIRKKDRVGQLKVAGAFIAAEIDRIQSNNP